MSAPLGPGDYLDISEYHTPEFHSSVRVSPSGTVTLPMVNEVKIGGLDEQSAARAIEAALVAKGMLLHPLVSVLVTVYAGQDVSVLGEVSRPGVYPYTLHHLAVWSTFFIATIQKRRIRSCSIPAESTPSPTTIPS
jgi:protein involved in polysaccharide export with SLBB domain